MPVKGTSSSTAGGNTPWPLSLGLQAAAINDAIAAFHVPVQVFMGMYEQETGLGTNVTNSSAGAIGPFQFIPSTATAMGYPLTNTPDLSQFRAQAHAAAQLLHDGFVTEGSWFASLEAYNAGPHNLPAGAGYAHNALAFVIPANWRAALADPANAGGTVGKGGTGSLSNDTSAFTVGNGQNPDENYWDAINRLSQERAWYSFSDAETLYIADGPDLMKQEPALNVHRLDDIDQISHLELTWDNCLDKTTPICTPNGWRTMGDLRRGDFVFGSDGKPTEIVKAHRTHYGRDCYRVTMDDGTSIVADGGHLWQTISRRRDEATEREISHQLYLGIRSTEEIAAFVRIPPSPSHSYGSYNHLIRQTPVLSLPEADLPIDPYVFGLWLGDGDSGGPALAVSEEDHEEIVASVAAAGYSYREKRREPRGISKRPSYRVALSLLPEYRPGRPNEDCLTKRLRALGVLNDKHIPTVYLRASAQQRLALLQGIMDTDGTVGKAEHVGGRGPGLGFANERLAKDSVDLIRSLGYRARGPKWQAPRGDSRPLFRIFFSPRDERNCFRLRRKAKRYAEQVQRRSWQRQYRPIVAVTRVPSVPVRCITVAAEDHLFLAGEGMTLTCNTAWQYAATHKKRKRTQRRTAFAKVTSPVEATLDFVCDIDACRAGDVVVLYQTGPGDGQWLAGDVRRSVFEVTSEITLVQALTPLTEGELNPAGVNKNNSLSDLVNSPIGVKGYTNPVGNWTPSRIDMGIDGTITGPYVAPGDSKIVAKYYGTGGGSWEGWYLAGQFTSGALKGKVWYVAEGITPLVPIGAAVGSGTPVARPGPTAFGTAGLIETGWADPGSPTRPLCTSMPGFGGDQSPPALACGDSFNRFVVKLGGKPAARQGVGLHVVASAMPGGYP